jgi:hypothetical protein
VVPYRKIHAGDRENLGSDGFGVGLLDGGDVAVEDREDLSV